MIGFSNLHHLLFTKMYFLFAPLLLRTPCTSGMDTLPDDGFEFLLRLWSKLCDNVLQIKVCVG